MGLIDLRNLLPLNCKYSSDPELRLKLGEFLLILHKESMIGQLQSQLWTLDPKLFWVINLFQNMISC
jgi:hypothetical protein